MRAVKNKKGFTLIELLVVLAIMGIVLTAITGLFVYVPTFFNKANTRSQLQSDAIALMETIELNIRTATAAQLGGTKPADMVEAVSASVLSEYKLSVMYEHSISLPGVVKVTLTGDGGNYVHSREIFLINNKNSGTDIITGAGSDSKMYVRKPS
ncbi:MAG: PilW family protein [Eubacteriales bacterium]